MKTTPDQPTFWSRGSASITGIRLWHQQAHKENVRGITTEMSPQTFIGGNSLRVTKSFSLLI